MEYTSYKEYKTSKSYFAKLLLSKHHQYEQKRLSDLENRYELDYRQFWRAIRNKRNKSSGWHSIKHNGTVYATPHQLRGLWTEHFANLLNENINEYDCYNNEHKTRVDATINDILHNIDIGSYDRTHDSVMTEPVTPYEIQEASHCLKNGKAPGFDLITYEHIKYGSDMLYVYLAKLFTLMLTECYIPRCFKVGVIIPLHKGKNKPKNLLKSYRGVTLMPVLNKVFDKIIWWRVKPILDKIGFPNPQQFACRPEHNSTLLSFTIQEAISHCLEFKSNVYCCFLDCEQAFDRVWWNGLLYKLHSIGIKGKLWL